MDFAFIREETVLLVLFLMFVGGSPASTAGGIKTTTFAILLLAACAQIAGKKDVEALGRRIPFRRVLQALSLTVVAGGTVLTVSLLLNYLEPTSGLQLVFETVSALGTVGLSMGVTSGLSDSSLFLLCLAMFAGRVGPLTLGVALVSQRRKGTMRHPPGDVAIG